MDTSFQLYECKHLYVLFFIEWNKHVANKYIWRLEVAHCVGASNKKKFSAWKYLGARCGASLRMGEVAPCREEGAGAC